MRQGQIVSHLFVYILGIITVALILLLGFQAITKLQQNKCTVQQTQFETSLAEAIDKDKGWGISRTEDFTLPCSATQVCFVSRQSSDTHQIVTDGTAAAQSIASQYEVIKSSIESGDSVNIFLHTANGFERLTRFEVAAPIALPGSAPIRCFPDPATPGTAQVSIRFKGQGQLVEVDRAGSS